MLGGELEHVEEEAKSFVESTHDPARVKENETMFKHLTYLSQVQKDLGPLQQVEPEGPGEYTLSMLDNTKVDPKLVTAETPTPTAKASRESMKRSGSTNDIFEIRN